MMAKPPNAMRTHVSRKPVAANGLSEERTSTALPFGNSATRSAALILERDRARRRERQRFNQLGQPHGSRFPRHSRKARGFFPGIDIEPRKRGKDAEPRSISIFANRCAEELVELRPNERRQRGVGHVSTRSSSLHRDLVGSGRHCERPLNCSLQVRNAERLLNEDGIWTRRHAPHRIAGDEHMRDEFASEDLFDGEEAARLAEVRRRRSSDPGANAKRRPPLWRHWSPRRRPRGRDPQAFSRAIHRELRRLPRPECAAPSSNNLPARRVAG